MEFNNAIDGVVDMRTLAEEKLATAEQREKTAVTKCREVQKLATELKGQLSLGCSMIGCYVMDDLATAERELAELRGTYESSHTSRLHAEKCVLRLQKELAKRDERIAELEQNNSDLQEIICDNTWCNNRIVTPFY